MPKDKKLNQKLEQSRVLKEETQLRLKEQSELFNTEQSGFMEVEHERERTLKVSQRELKATLPVQAA